MIRARLTLAAAAVCAAACGAAAPRFPADVHAALGDQPMRRLETASLVIYYPAKRHDQVLRFAARAEGCAGELSAKAQLRNGFWSEKPVLVMPEMPFNNAFVAPAALGSEEISVVPTFNTLDFATEFGLPPDPAYIACHELVHYVQFQQIAGMWGTLDRIFGHLISPQVGLDSWFFEGLATHYEASLQPGAGRPRWPVFRGMFHAGYAGRGIDGGDLSELGRRAPPGHNYLVGTFFVDFLFERYGEQKVWRLIANQGRSALLMFNVNGRFKSAFGTSLSALIDEFETWTRDRFPVRATPADQRRVRSLGLDARYARSSNGHEAAIWNDVDAPTRLTVWAPDGRQRASLRLVDLVPPRALVTAAPILTTGLGVTRDGAVYFTTIDVAATYQTTRLMRWNGELSEVASGLGPGAGVDATATTYYYLAVDGDRWQLAAYDLASGKRRTVTATEPGQYVLGAQVSPDGTRLIASVWDHGFVLWVIDAASGARLSEIRTADQSPLYDGAFADDGTVTYLATVDGRFQIVSRDLATGATRTLTDAPYAVLNPRVSGGRVRFLNRDGWRWTVDEVAFAVPAPAAPTAAAPGAPADGAVVADADAVQTPATAAAVQTPATAPTAPPANPADTPSLVLAGFRATPATAAVTVVSDRPYSYFDRLFVPQLHTFAVGSPDGEATLLGVALSGGDRLGFQRWGLAGFVQPDTGLLSGQASYINAMLAPWMVVAGAVYLDWYEGHTDKFDSAGIKTYDHHIQRQVALSVGRSWRETLGAALTAVGSEDRDAEIIERRETAPDTDRTDETFAPRRRMAGLGLSLELTAMDSSRIASHGWWTTASAFYYPQDLSSLVVDVTDVRGSFGVYAPVPFTRRHTLRAVVRGRGLVSDDDDLNLLRLGGAPLLAIAWDRSTDRDGPDPGDDPRLPDAASFQEPLRGYEDFTILTDRAGLAEVSWKYPLVIDRGIATTVWLLPASFLRQIDLELFASAAVDDRGDDGFHAAAGAAATLSLSFLRVPLSVGYQIARRLVDDDAIVQLVLIGVAL